MDALPNTHYEIKDSLRHNNSAPSRSYTIEAVTLRDALLVIGPVTRTDNLNTGTWSVTKINTHAYRACGVASPASTAFTVAVYLVPAGALLASRPTAAAVAATACTVNVTGAVFPMGLDLRVARSVITTATAEWSCSIDVTVGIPCFRAFRGAALSIGVSTYQYANANSHQQYFE
ncbi:MAG: hypothetical protein GY696_13330 [Gammaproteobacteria bacterium]|nr:hypothetical protein [Gammaproteobacteria bacterium]